MKNGDGSLAVGSNLQRGSAPLPLPRASLAVWDLVSLLVCWFEWGGGGGGLDLGGGGRRGGGADRACQSGSQLVSQEVPGS